MFISLQLQERRLMCIKKEIIPLLHTDDVNETSRKFSDG